jgi:probable rRNA maturation factor
MPKSAIVAPNKAKNSSSKKSIAVTVLSHDPRWRGYVPTVKRAADATFRHQKIKQGSVTLVLSNDKEVRLLNRDYRKKDKPTNVLSFPDGTMDGDVMHLGDVILAYETIVAEAASQEKKLKNHLTHLVIHGILHILGYDHNTSKKADIMEVYEITILARMGIANPYRTA